MMPKHTHLSHPKYRPDIDGLRAIAVLSVVAFHAFPNWIKGGFIGVDVFFVISGYLISTILFENLGGGTFSFSEFYFRRVKRIFPALILVLISCFVFGWFALLADEFKQLGKHIAASTIFVSNMVLWSESGYFNNSAETKPLLHLWSLGIEEQFYLVWPILLWFSWQRKFNILIATLVLAVASFILNVEEIKQDAVATFYSPQTRFWELLSGSLLAWLTLHGGVYFADARNKANNRISLILYNNKKSFPDGFLPNILSLLGLFFLGYAIIAINKESIFPGKLALIPVSGAIMIILAGPSAWINRVVLSNGILIWFGLISFPLYLWHWPLLSFVRIIAGEVPSAEVRIAAVLISIILSWLTYKLVERPVRLREFGRAKVLLLLISMIFMGGAGYNAYINDGFDSRESIKNLASNRNELLRRPAVDNECLDSIGIKEPLFTYCRFTNANSDETVALIGDSHAHAAYPGVAEYLRERGKNTVLLANSSCPPFFGVSTGENESRKNACRLRIEQLMSTLVSLKHVKKIFIFTRGPIYITGTEPISGSNMAMNGSVIPLDDFVAGAQKSIDYLFKNGKEIFYVTENPELSFTPEACIERPFKYNTRNCSSDKLSVSGRQRDYLNAMGKLKNVVIINSIDTFCPNNNCLVFNGAGKLLYADGDHLSIAGSRFQVDQLLVNYLQ